MSEKEQLKNKIRELEKELAQLKNKDKTPLKNPAMLEILIETIPDLIWLKDPDGVFLFCNSRFAKRLGFSPPDITGKTDADLLGSEKAKIIREKDLAAIAEKGPVIYRENPSFDGQPKHKLLETIKTPMMDTDGNLMGVLSISRDVTRFKKIQDELEDRVRKRTRDLAETNKALKEKIQTQAQVKKQLQESRNQLFVHLENTPVGAITTDTDFKIRVWNPAAQTIFGYTKEEAMGKDLLDLIVPEDQKKNVQVVFKKLMAGEGGRRNTNENITAAGKRIICDWYNTIIYDTDQKIIGYASLVNDITLQVEREKKLSWFAKVIEQADEEVLVTNASGIIQYVNPSFEKNTGYSLSEVTGRTPSILKSGHHDEQFYKTLWETLLEKKIWRGRIHNKTKSDQILIHDMVISPILDSDAVISGFVSIRRNVTEQVQKDQQVQQSRKMEAIGTLAGGIAHDFNNILSGIFGYAQLACRNIDDKERLKKNIDRITQGARRATELVQQILTFSRQTENKKQTVTPYLIIKEALKLLRSSIPATIEIQERIQCRDMIFANPTQIYQIIMNLCTNAYHAMRETGGILLVSLEKTDISTPVDIPGLIMPPGSYIRICIKDSGCGIPPDNMNRIFEPYFTTKEMGEGTGLGLAVVLGIVQEHNGYIKADSEPGKGSVFSIYFPVFHRNTAKNQTGEKFESVQIPTGTETIMVVDDDEMVLMSLRDLLVDQGYSVKTYQDSKKALTVFKNNPGNIDLLITDMTMPKMTGDALAAHVLGLKKDLPVILCTGYSDDTTKTKLEKIKITRLLKKPVDPDLLLALIRETLDGKGK